MKIEIIHQEYGHERKSRWIVMGGDSVLEEVLPETAEAIRQLQAELEKYKNFVDTVKSFRVILQGTSFEKAFDVELRKLNNDC